MADYFTHFSCLLDVGTPDKAARALALFQVLRTADQDADDPEVAGFDLVRQDAPEGSAIWIHDDDHGDVEAVIAGRATAGPQLEAEPGAAPRVVELHAEAGRLATEHRLAAPGAHGEIHQVAKGVVDAHPGDAADQEGQREAEAEGVVDGGQQHHQKC